jgi:cytoplasmic iron level regulating protein YaaA (DUF328/UPF0246 family)
VYDGISVSQYQKADMDFAQSTVRILSGLYGVLRPLDLIQPYRLEMSTKLPNPKGDNLYDYWKASLTDHVNQELEQNGHKAVINLASNEYFKALDDQKIAKPIVTPVFKEYKNGAYKTIAIYAKKARGMMTDYIVQHRLTDPEGLKGFDQDGYSFEPEMSTDEKLVFIR